MADGEFFFSKDAEGNVVGTAETKAEAHAHVLIDVKDPHKWNGMADPYCYTATATILKDGEALDAVTVTYGYRSFHVAPNTGFHLNGKSVPLHGVSRHHVLGHLQRDSHRTRQ